MNIETTNDAELFRTCLEMPDGETDFDSIRRLESLLQRHPGHMQAIYLLAATYAQVGLLQPAEAGFRAVIDAAPDFGIARLQLGLLLAVLDRGSEARECLAPMIETTAASGAYARGIAAATAGEAHLAVKELEAGLALLQDVPAAMAFDMRNLIDRLTAGMAEKAEDLEGSQDTEQVSRQLYVPNAYRNSDNDS